MTYEPRTRSAGGCGYHRFHLLVSNQRVYHVNGREESHGLYIEPPLDILQCFVDGNDISVTEHVCGNKVAVDLQSQAVDYPGAGVAFADRYVPYNQ